MNNSKAGYTLIELVISLGLVVMAIGVGGSMIKTQFFSLETITSKIEAENLVRYPMTVLEKQIKDTDLVYVYNDIVYFRDMESNAYFNNYALSGDMVYKYKTSETLGSIGIGGTSQFADSLSNFEITSLPDGRIRVFLESTFNGRTFSQEKFLSLDCPVYTID
ncbi:hypothetical protein [Alkalibacter mobilis]|uniref:hypothetical protein n=1 Tax=Alkalibacter mobilis TaxID=2787712 RepID=UPI00189E1238|nr:hypothetical protein [Alkalibacter mobilis]MBF7095755.1 hypothetical protein [Alkalibacter mobilis]